VINGGFVTGEVQWIGGNDGWAKRWQAWWLCSMEEVAERVEWRAGVCKIGSREWS